jgi:hypothetical protein
MLVTMVASTWEILISHFLLPSVVIVQVLPLTVMVFPTTQLAAATATVMTPAAATEAVTTSVMSWCRLAHGGVLTVIADFESFDL